MPGMFSVNLVLFSFFENTFCIIGVSYRSHISLNMYYLHCVKVSSLILLQQSYP